MKKIGLTFALCMAMGCGFAEAARPDYAAQALQKDYQLLREYKLKEARQKPLQDNLDTAGPVILGKVTVEGNRKLPASYVLKRIPCQEGKELDVKKLKKLLLFFNNTNLAQLQAKLVPASAEGQVELKLKVVEPKNKNCFFVDNAGLKDTGSMRIAFHRESYGFLHNDDVLSGIKYWSRGSWGGYTTYETPFSHKGLRAFGGIVKERVKAVKGNWDGKYKSDLYDLWGSLRQPLVVKENMKLETFGELHYKWYDTDYKEFGGKTFADRRAYTGSYGFMLRSFDKNSITNAKLAATLYLEKTSAGYEANSSKRGWYWQGEIFHQRELGKQQKLDLRAVGLYSTKDSLPATEGISIGGAHSVRGFEEGVMQLTKGMYGTLEYSAPLNRSGLKGHAFYDYGFGYIEEKDNVNSMTSCGIGLSYERKGWLSKLTLGIPLTYNLDEKPASARLHFLLQKSI